MDETGGTKKKNKRKSKNKGWIYQNPNIICGEEVSLSDEIQNEEKFDAIDCNGDEEVQETGEESIEANSVLVVENTGNIVKDARVFRHGNFSKSPPEIVEEEQKEIEQQEIERPEFLNKKALSKYAQTYELEKFEKNILLIFNQENIDGFRPRLGTEKDVSALRDTFEVFGFEVTEHRDLSKEDIFKELDILTTKDFTEYGCIAVAVLTHGSKHGLLRARDQQYNEIEILNYLKTQNNPTLVTKPRVLLIQACRGTQSTAGMAIQQVAKIRKDVDDELEPYYLPVESDILVVHSSYVGKPSYRNELYGSWFIQTLCRKIEELAAVVDLESILTEVKREIAIDRYHEEYNRRTFEIDVNKQIPVMTSTLIRKLYINKFHYQTVNKQPVTMTIDENNVETKEIIDNGVLTPLRLQFGPCSCFLDHFNYIRDCLRFFVEETPEDLIAKSYLDLAETFEDTSEFNATKERMLKVICAHLSTNSKDFQYYKYIHFYKS